MSYVVHVVHAKPLPKTAKAGFALLDSSKGAAGDQDSVERFRFLARWLHRRYADHDGAAGGSGDAAFESPLLEEPPSPDSASRSAPSEMNSGVHSGVLSIALNLRSPRVVSMVSDLRLQCAMLDLTLLDPQQGVVLLPDDRELGGAFALPGVQAAPARTEVSAPASPERVDEAGSTRDFAKGGRMRYDEQQIVPAFGAQIREAFGPVLSRSGFEASAGIGGQTTEKNPVLDVHRTIPDGVQNLLIRVHRNYPRLFYGACVETHAETWYPPAVPELGAKLISRLDENTMVRVLPKMSLHLGRVLAVCGAFDRRSSDDASVLATRSSTHRNFAGSAPDAPPLDTFWDSLPFNNQEEFRRVTIPRFTRVLETEILPALHQTSTLRGVADYVLEHGYDNFFSISHPDTISTWLVIIGMERPERLRDSCERFERFMCGGEYGRRYRDDGEWLSREDEKEIGDEYMAFVRVLRKHFRQ